MGLVLSSLCRFLSSLRHLLSLDTPKLPLEPLGSTEAEPVTALPLFNGQMVLYTYANGDLVGIDSDRRVLLRESIPKEIGRDVFRPPAAPSVPRLVEALPPWRFLAEHLEASPARPAVLGTWATETWKALGKCLGSAARVKPKGMVGWVDDGLMMGELMVGYGAFIYFNMLFMIFSEVQLGGLGMFRKENRKMWVDHVRLSDNCQLDKD
eukprot:Skav201925  [mRNA]  locus=scaffold3992:296304:298373:+ [translate_table: standard]